MTDKVLFLFILVPLAGAILIFLSPKRFYAFKALFCLVATALNLLIALKLFNKNLTCSIPWFLGIELSLRLYHFSAFIITASALFGFLTALYSVSFLRDKNYSGQFFLYLMLTIVSVNGVVLSDNLLALLFFWESFLLITFGMIYIGGKNSFKTASKAFIIIGITDLCMLTGIALTGTLSGTLTISKISLPLNLLGSIAFILLITGAISKAGSMPFHSWIPDAAIDAPLPFMAFLPAALEKLLGIYFLTRISIDMFQMNVDSFVSMILMTVGAITIILAVLMALVQKDYKKLLSYHAISQVGYMILGIGTAVPAGIIGGLFHMINNAVYKSCLFFTGGAVEKQTGTTDLEKLGGLGAKMPVTFACFFITALSISGVPPFNGFFSKELVYNGSLERGFIFYLAAVTGSFFTAASFLKLGHAVYFEKLKEENKNVKETLFPMLIPMIVLAVLCIFFGIYNSFPIDKLIKPSLGGQIQSFSENILDKKLVIITLIVLAGAVFNHIYGVKMKGKALMAVDHIHNAPYLKSAYEKAEKDSSDPYNIGLAIINKLSKITWKLDRGINWIYDNLSVSSAFKAANIIRSLHNGNYSRYIVWALFAMFIIIKILMKEI